MSRCAPLLALGLLPLLVAADGPTEATIAFRDRTDEAGLRAPLLGLMGHGAAWGDYDGDGRPDLFVGGFSDRPAAEYRPAPGPVANCLFRNRGNGRFEAVTGSPAQVHARTSGAVFTDLDNDGLPELYVANNARARARRSDEPQRSAQLRTSQLFRNDRGKLVEISADCSACPPTLLSARNVVPLDYDGDGLLDLLVVEDRFTPRPRTTLFRNRGGLRFEDVTRAVRLPEDLHGLGLAVADLNADSRPDFFVPHSNRLYLSRGDGTYREAESLRPVFAYRPLDGEDWPCGAAFGDLDGDGRLDLVVSAHHNPARNRVFRNEGLQDGVPRFREVTEEVGLGDAVPAKCPHVEIQDFDNDGRPDIYFSAGWLDGMTVVPLIYRNLGVRDGLPRFAPPRLIRGPMVYYPAGPSADYDGDGRLDLFLVNWFAGDTCHLLHNGSPKRHWLDVQVRGKTMNRMGLGARVRLTRAGRLVGFQEIAIGSGYASGQLPVAHFGLGDADTVDVEVALPGGKKLVRREVKADQRVVMEE